jgi:hypothetical protein
MPVYVERAQPLMQQFKDATEAESKAISELHDYMQSGGRERMIELTAKMEEAHNKKMRIYRKMQEFRID